MARSLRVVLAVAWFLATETLVIGAAAWPTLLAWTLLLRATADAPTAIRGAALAATLAPGLLAFGLLLLALSALACRVMRWRAPPDRELPLGPLEWPLLRWAAYASCTHVASLLVGTWLRATPAWTWYIRANGARVGRGVYVNSIRVGDHNLLELGDGVVIGSDVHLSGHTVEHGRLVTHRTRIGAGAVIGIGSIVSPGAEIGAGAHVGALSFVPKHARLRDRGRYVGVPARVIDDQPPSVNGG